MALPETIQTIVGIIGHGPAMNLVSEFGGREIRFPATRNGANWEALVEVVGERHAKGLCEHFAGNEIYIALCANAIRHDRNCRLIKRYDQLLQQGHSSRGAVGILTQEFRPISNRAVENIINSPTPSMVPEMLQQGQLF